ncbi:MAG: HGxxPAAW family protein [Dermabacter sp.]|nr:HGxxPAAW family protein [Dermabacter sp.]
MPKTYRVPPAPPHNEGKTIAAWTFAVFTVLGSIGIAFSMVLEQPSLLWAGLGAMVLGCVVAFVLRVMGFGQKAKS